MEIVESNVITIFVIGSIGTASDRLFFDTLNIKFSDQESMYKVYSKNYAYKGKKYKYILHFISGTFIDPGLLARQSVNCDVLLLLANPLVKDVFYNMEMVIVQTAKAHPNTLAAVVMQNIFEDLDNLTPEGQELALYNGEMFCELDNYYNLKVISLNYTLDEIDALESGDPAISLKFYKMFNDAFYELLHEAIERFENPELKTEVAKPESREI